MKYNHECYTYHVLCIIMSLVTFYLLVTVYHHLMYVAVFVCDDKWMYQVFVYSTLGCCCCVSDDTVVYFHTNYCKCDKYPYKCPPSTAARCHGYNYPKKTTYNIICHS